MVEMKASLSEDEVVMHLTGPNAQFVIGGAERAGGAGAAGSALGRRLVGAARAGDTAQVRALLALGAPLATDWLGTSALHVAAAHDQADTVAALLRAGVSRDARTKVERTPLHVAACAGAVGAARALLAGGAMADARDMLAMTPLHWAAERAHAPLVALLLQHGADPRALSKFLKTPAMLARDPATRRLIDAALQAKPPSPPAKQTAEAEEVHIESSPEPERREGAAAAQEAPARADHAPQSGAGERDAAGDAEAAALLRAHGIAPLPPDTGGTVLSALQSGRTVVLSDAGKLVLRESGGGGGVVVRATPVSAPPGPGVKVFTVAARAAPAPAPPPPPRPPPDEPNNRPTVKIFMNRANFSKLVGSALRPHGVDAGLARAALGDCAALTVSVPERFVRSNSPAYLRSQLVAAHAAIHALAKHLPARDPPPPATSPDPSPQ